MTIDIEAAVEKKAAEFRAEQCAKFSKALADILGIELAPTTYILQITDELRICAAELRSHRIAVEGDRVAERCFWLCYGRKRREDCYNWQQVARALQKWDLYIPKPPVASPEHQAAEAELNEFLTTRTENHGDGA